MLRAVELFHSYRVRSWGQTTPVAAGLSMFSLPYSTHTVVLSVLPSPIQKVDQYSSYDRAVLDSVESSTLIRKVKEAFLKEITSKLRNTEMLSGSGCMARD